MQVSELQSELSETKASLKIFTSSKEKLDKILNAQIIGNQKFGLGYNGSSSQQNKTIFVPASNKEIK